MLLQQDSLLNHPSTANIMGDATTPPRQTSKSPRPPPEFSPTTCLFCNATSRSAEETALHMHKYHGFQVPDQEALTVDSDVLLEYLHLIIFEYNECLYCHTERRTSQAAQQHMTGTGHCKIDLDEEDSEFLDFYECGSEASSSDMGSESENDEMQLQRRGQRPSETPVKVDSSTMRLPSGKILSSRTTKQRNPSRKPLQPSSNSRPRVTTEPTPEDPTPGEPTPESNQIPRSSKAVARQERKASAFAVQVSNLRAGDRMALANLSTAQKRSALTQTLKQVASSNREQKEFRGHMDAQGNVASKARFVNDVPGGKAHKNRFFAQ